MKTSWTAATLLCTAFLVGCSGSTPENTQNFEQNALAAPADPSTPPVTESRARRTGTVVGSGQVSSHHSTRARREAGRNDPARAGAFAAADGGIRCAASGRASAQPPAVSRGDGPGEQLVVAGTDDGALI